MYMYIVLKIAREINWALTHKFPLQDFLSFEFMLLIPILAKELVIILVRGGINEVLCIFSWSDIPVCVSC